MKMDVITLTDPGALTPGDDPMSLPMVALDLLLILSSEQAEIE